MKTYVNLLPQSLLDRQLLRASLRRWLLVWTSAAIVAGLVIWAERLQLTAAKQRRAQLEADYLPIKRLEQQSRVFRRRLAHLRANQPASLTEVKYHPVTTALAVLSKAVDDCDGKLCVQTFAFEEHFPQPEEKRVQPPRVSLNVAGLAVENLAIAQCAAALRDSGLFSDIDVQVMANKGSSDGNSRSYKIACVLQ